MTGPISNDKNSDIAFADNHETSWPDFEKSHYGVLTALKDVVENRPYLEIVNWIVPKLIDMHQMEHVWASLTASNDERLNKIGSLCKLVFNAYHAMGSAYINQKQAADGNYKICIDRDWPEDEYCFNISPDESLAKAEKAKADAISTVTNILIAGVSPDVFDHFWGDKALVEEVIEKAGILISHTESEVALSGCAAENSLNQEIF